jgi:dihydrodipicolinate synthase/N-acetylneuraminate lyase
MAGERLSGTLAAAVTPLRGDAPDLDAIPALVDFYARTGLDGALVLGTTGEGMLLSASERRSVAEAFCSAARRRIDVAVHCGAQSTRDTAALAEHAAAAGAAAVAVVAPPYYPLDEASLVRHFAEAAAACAPLPFYVYEFAARSGYAVPVTVVERLRGVADNLAGLKVSDAPFERVRPYLLEGLDVFIGAESLIHEGMRHGATGAVSGLAAALPELTVEAVRTRTAAAAARAGRVREALQRFPFQSALKSLLRMRDLPMQPDVRAPLRALDAREQAELRRLAEEPEGELHAILAA